MDFSDLKRELRHPDQTGLVMRIFHHQSRHCQVYRRWLSLIGVDPSKINDPAEIPYLPIDFFKYFEVKTGEFTEEVCFESSSTSGKGLSRHYVRSLENYTHSFTTSFAHFFGDHRQYCHLALLPSYLERKNSSLIFQVGHFVNDTADKGSAFYLYEHEKLAAKLRSNEEAGISTMLWGVSFALLDFADAFPMSLKHTVIVETGGMKGRRKEITRAELHESLQSAFLLDHIAGEYGMTELMSQAYSLKNGLYRCPPGMSVTAREVNDPLSRPVYGRHGAINVTDLGNLDSCSFIATSDLGRVFDDGSFEILGRMDFSDTRGCNLMV